MDIYSCHPTISSSFEEKNMKSMHYRCKGTLEQLNEEKAADCPDWLPSYPYLAIVTKLLLLVIAPFLRTRRRSGIVDTANQESASCSISLTNAFLAGL